MAERLRSTDATAAIVEQLQDELRRERAISAAERTRATLLEASLKRAYSFATGARPRRKDAAPESSPLD